MQERIIFGIKAFLTACGYVFLFAVLIWDPANLIILTGSPTSEYDDGAKAAGCALIAAMVFAIHRIPTRVGHRDEYLELLIWILVTSATFMAAWWWLSDETGGNPRPYLEEILIVAGVITVTGLLSLAVGAGGSLLFGKRKRDD